MWKKCFDYKYREALALSKGTKRSSDSDINGLADLLRLYINQQVIPETPLNRAFEIYAYGTQSKIMMEASLLAADATNERIAEVFDMHVDTIASYRLFFFDTEQIKDKADVVEYLGTLHEDHQRAEFIAKSDAVRYGFYTVVDNLAVGNSVRTADDIVNAGIQMADYFVRQASFSNITSAAAKEAKDWYKVAMALGKSRAEMQKQVGAETTEIDFRQLLLKPKKETLDLKQIAHQLVK